MTKIYIDYAYTVAYEAVRIIIPLATAPYIARVLGAEGIGAHAYTHSIASYFLLFALLGVKTHGNRSIAAARHDRQERARVFSNIYCAQLGGALLCALAFVGYVRLVAEPELSVLFHLQILYVGSAFVDIDWFFFGIGQFKKIAVRSAAVKILMAAPVFLFVRSEADLPVYTVIVTSGFFISPLLLMIMARSEIAFVRPSVLGVLQNLKSMLVLFLPVVAVSLYRMTGKIMLGSMADMAELGYFENAEKMVGVAVGIITAFGTVMLPRMSRLFAQGEVEKSIRYIARSMEFTMPVASALSFGLIAVAPHLAVVFYGNAFAACAPLISGLAVTIPLLAFGNVIRTHYLIPSRRDATYILSGFLGAFINLGLNIFLIPSCGALGAVIAAIAAEFIVVLYQTVSARRAIQWKSYLQSSVFPLGAGVTMCILVRGLVNRAQPTIGSLLTAIAAGAALYIVFYTAYLCIRKRSDLARLLLYVRVNVMPGGERRRL